jgi:putative membrane protein
MAHKVSHLFSPADLERIRAAVKAAEGGTSGEIVPYLVDASDDYEEAEWRSGCLIAVLVLIAAAAVHHFSDVWLPLDFAFLLLATGLSVLGGILLVKFAPPLKRLFAGKHLIDRRVSARAAQAFLSEEVFKTRERTGILIFVSVLEHKVLIIGDSGINAKVAKADWQEAVDALTNAIAHDKPTEGLIEAISRAGKLLERAGVTRRGDDTDELSDDLRVRER